MDVRGKTSNEKRLIDANAFLKDILTAGIGKTIIEYSESDIGYMIRKRPTVDAVEVVRCRECKQGEVDDPDFPDEYYCHAGCGWNNGDFYCAYGELKEGADNGWVYP